MGTRHTDILEKGLLIPRTIYFEVADGVQHAQKADPEKVKGFGDFPITMQFRLDDGSVIEIAASSEEEKLAQGPFSSDEKNKNKQ